jgi:glucosylceramidase
MSAGQQAEFIERYFGGSGIGYTMGRVHINSCDFSLGSYSFDDVENDFKLAHFDHGVSHDAETLIPLILKAQQSVAAAGRQLRLLAAPWSPPAWMKTNGQMDSSGSSGLRAECRDVWARYIAAWVSAYKAHGIPIWGLSVQNEPSNRPAWEACAYNPTEEADFVAAFLGPTMQQAHPEVAIFVHDDSKHNLVTYAQTALGRAASARFIKGIAFHWYTGDLFENVAQVHRQFPQAQLLASEATYEKRRWRQGALQAYSEWSFGEGYAHDIIGDLNAGAAGWIDWNLLLDKDGGPNHVGNVCDAAAIADNRTGSLEWHPQYYYVGHFSKFMVPDSRHVQTTVTGSARYAGAVRDYGTCSAQDGLEATAAIRPDGQLVVVVLNCGGAAVVFQLKHVLIKRALQATIPPHAIQTYLLDGCSQGA